MEIPKKLMPAMKTINESSQMQKFNIRLNIASYEIKRVKGIFIKSNMNSKKEIFL